VGKQVSTCYGHGGWRLWALAAAAFISLAGCSASPKQREAQIQAERNAAAQAVERLSTIIANGEATPSARQEVDSIVRDLKLMPRTAAVPAMIRSLRTGQDEFNSTIIHLLDDLNATDWVPVKFRARTITIETTVDLARRRVRSAEKADAYIDHIRRFCSAEPAQMVAVWLQFLESPPILARLAGKKVNITRNVQGVALLGLIRSTQGSDLTTLLRAVKENRTTAPPVLLSQPLIHLSGTALKSNLDQWLAGPQAAQQTALIAVELLRLQSPALTLPADAKRLADAKAWVRRLPANADWRTPLSAELATLATAASKKKPLSKEDLARLARARLWLRVPARDDPVRWLTRQPSSDRRRALERLAGIDILLHPPVP